MAGLTSRTHNFVNGRFDGVGPGAGRGAGERVDRLRTLDQIVLYILGELESTGRDFHPSTDKVRVSIFYHELDSRGKAWFEQRYGGKPCGTSERVPNKINFSSRLNFFEVLASYSNFCHCREQSPPHFSVSEQQQDQQHPQDQQQQQQDQVDGDSSSSSIGALPRRVGPNHAQALRLYLVDSVLQLNSSGELHNAPAAFINIVNVLDKDASLQDQDRLDILALAWHCLQRLLKDPRHPWLAKPTLPDTYSAASEHIRVTFGQQADESHQPSNTQAAAANTASFRNVIVSATSISPVAVAAGNFALALILALAGQLLRKMQPPHVAGKLLSHPFAPRLSQSRSRWIDADTDADVSLEVMRRVEAHPRLDSRINTSAQKNTLPWSASDVQVTPSPQSSLAHGDFSADSYPLDWDLIEEGDPESEAEPWDQREDLAAASTPGRRTVDLNAPFPPVPALQDDREQQSLSLDDVESRHSNDLGEQQQQQQLNDDDDDDCEPLPPGSCHHVIVVQQKVQPRSSFPSKGGFLYKNKMKAFRQTRCLFCHRYKSWPPKKANEVWVETQAPAEASNIRTSKRGPPNLYFRLSHLRRRRSARSSVDDQDEQDQQQEEEEQE